MGSDSNAIRSVWQPDADVALRREWAAGGGSIGGSRRRRIHVRSARQYYEPDVIWPGPKNDRRSTRLCQAGDGMAGCDTVAGALLRCEGTANAGFGRRVRGAP